MNYIYTLSNIDTNEVKYVGKTNNIKERYRKHVENMLKRKTYLYSWMKSLNNLPKIEILDEFDDNDDWQFWEQYWISQLKTWGFKLTNATIGGDGGNNFFSEKTIEKLREINIGEKNPFYGKTHTKETIEKIKFANIGKVVSEETKNKISKSKMGHTFEDDVIEKFRLNCINGISGMKNKNHSDETKLKMSKIKIGKKLKKETKEKLSEISKVKIMCVENEITYNSINDAAIDLKINRSKISLCLTNKIESCNGYHFNYINNITKIDKICVNCGEKYVAQRKNSNCCSFNCSVKNSKNKLKK